MKAVVWTSLLLCVFLGIAVESGTQTPAGALAIEEPGRPVGLGRGLQDGGGCAGAGATEGRRGLLWC